MQKKHNNNLILNNFTIKQLYNNKHIFNCLSSSTQTTIKMYKNYNCTLQQLTFVQAYNSNYITKTIQAIKQYNKIIKSL